MESTENRARSESEADQFQRTRLMLGEEGLRRVRSSCVMVVGLGAVGSYVVEALARAGVGRFRIVDFDDVQESNINRQLFATHETIGKAKADLAETRVHAINPSALVEKRKLLVNPETVASLFEGEWSGKPDYVVDAIDTLGSKVALLTETTRRGVPVMSSMGAALRFDASLVRVGKLTEVTNCPLSAQVRKRLRRFGVNTDDVRCAYSPEPIRDAMRAGDERFERFEPTSAKPVPGPEGKNYPQGRPRNTLGSLPTIVGIFGLRIAHEVIMDISGLSDQDQTYKG